MGWCILEEFCMPEKETLGIFNHESKTLRGGVIDQPILY